MRCRNMRDKRGREKETGRQRDRERDRQTERQREISFAGSSGVIDQKIAVGKLLMGYTTQPAECLRPCLPATPCSTAAAASLGVRIPFRTTFKGETLCNHAILAQVKDRVRLANLSANVCRINSAKQSKQDSMHATCQYTKERSHAS